MLEELAIRSVGVIDEAVLELGPGFTVVTGETGAGKTMVVTALGLLLGARADVGAVRGGAGKARVDGRVRIDPGSPAWRRADDIGADLDDETLILERTVSAEGRSRANVGGAAVPVGTLADLTADLVTVHGQSDQQRLLQPAVQRETLDAFGGGSHAELVDRFRTSYDGLTTIRAELEDIVQRRRERAQEADALRFGLGEVEAASPEPGEDVSLAAEEGRLAHVEGLRQAADVARFALSGDETDVDGRDALSLVAAARKAVEAERHHDDRLADLAEALASASYALADVAADLSAYATSLDVDPARLGWVQDRRATLTALTRKYGDTIDDVLAWSGRAASRLLELEDDDARLEALRGEEAAAAEAMAAAGTELSAARRALADALAGRVSTELAELAMPQAEFTVDVRPGETPTRSGYDEVTFCFAAHAGAPARPLQRGASGGELSRVMLALEVCLVGTQPVPTMIFDEVDAGVGGKAAVEVGRRLARLAKAVQVIVVTHLPQVAAFADQHYVVVKTDDGRVTTAGVTALDEAGRRSELSRMLAGLEDSESALAHADELLELRHSLD
ncbi:MAG TPA: DNA repair protein RecN [Nocardioidaceae bacterium]|jgi:DNA repair protein RecN (Recombination protein N)